MSADIADAFRTVALALGCSVLMTHAFLFWRIYRFAVPPFAARSVILSGQILIIFAMLEVYDHLDKPMTWRTPLVFSAFVIHEVGLLLFYHWTHRPDGRKVRHRMRAEYAAYRMLEKEGSAP